MKTRLLLFLFALVMLMMGYTGAAQAQQTASVTWSCVLPDSQHPSTPIGNLVAQDITGTDTFVVRSYTGTPNGPLGTTHMRWWPYAGGAALSWGNETAENPFRYVQLRVAPTSGHRFDADSVSVYLLGGGTSGMRVNIYYSKDPAFVTRTLLNTDSAVALLNSGSASSSVRFAYRLGVTVDNGQTLYVRFYPYYTGAPSTSKYLYTQQAIIKGTTSPSTGVDDWSTTPAGWRISQNYPNPFNPSTEISFSVERSGHATLHVYNLLGERVATLFDQAAEMGRNYRVTFDGAGLGSGVYFYRLTAGTKSEMKSMVLVR